MPESLKHTYRCSICGRTYTSNDREKAFKRAKQCEEKHKVVYVPLLRADVESLLNFIVTKEDRFLTKTLWDTLKRYRKLR